MLMCFTAVLSYYGLLQTVTTDTECIILEMELMDDVHQLLLLKSQMLKRDKTDLGGHCPYTNTAMILIGHSGCALHCRDVQLHFWGCSVCSYMSSRLDGFDKL